MRNLWTAAAVASAAMIAQAADAQAPAPGASYAPPMIHSAVPGRTVTTTTIQRRDGGWQGPRGNGPRMRWGQPVGGRWHGGVRAPGGWGAYRRPVRGWVLPGYWFAPSFYVNDYAAYGLGAPPYGHRWTRYYDDAVLIDGRGRVYDSVSGLDWDGHDRRPLPPIAPDHAPPPPPGYGYHDGHGDARTWVAAGSSYAAGSTIVRVEPTVTTTTTTTTEYFYEPARASVRPAYRHRTPAVRSKILRRSVK